MNVFSIVSRVVFGAMLAACGGNVDAASSSSESSGQEPVISNLRISEAQVSVNANSSLEGIVHFQDPDGDLLEIAVDFQMPGNSAWTRGARTKVPGSAGIKAGDLRVGVQFVLPKAGSYPFAVYVVDSNGHESNRLTGAVFAK